MAIFGKSESDPDTDERPERRVVAPPVSEERRQRAWIGASVVVTGDLSSSEDLTIAGRLEGDVTVPKNAVAIAPSATVRGNVSARAVIVHGTVQGSINAKERVELGAQGYVEGDIRTPQMKVEEGAKVKGQIHIGG